MPMDSQLSDARRRLAAFSGIYRGESEIHPNPFAPAGPSEGEWRFSMDGSGLHLLQDFDERRVDRSAFHGHGVLSVDRDSGDIVWFWFDSLGWLPLPPARGRFEGPHLVLERRTARGTNRSILTLEGTMLGHEILFRQPDAEDFVPLVTGRYRRVEDRP